MTATRYKLHTSTGLLLVESSIHRGWRAVASLLRNPNQGDPSLFSQDSVNATVIILNVSRYDDVDGVWPPNRAKLRSFREEFERSEKRREKSFVAEIEQRPRPNQRSQTINYRSTSDGMSRENGKPRFCFPRVGVQWWRITLRVQAFRIGALAAECQSECCAPRKKFPIFLSLAVLQFAYDARNPIPR